MNKWLKIGSILGVTAVILAGVALAAFWLRPTPANAQRGIFQRGHGAVVQQPPMPPFAAGGQNFAGPQEMDGLMGPRGRGGFGGFGPQIDRDQLLADALGITVEDLQAARLKAEQAAVQKMLDEGWIGQKQADLMLARLALRDYLDRDVLTAEALGITVEDLQAARDEGKTLRDLLDEQNIDPQDFRDALQEAHQAAIDQAVQEGVITQEQADLLQNARPGFDGGFGPGGHPGGRGGSRPGPGGPGMGFGPGK